MNARDDAQNQEDPMRLHLTHQLTCVIRAPYVGASTTLATALAGSMDDGRWVLVEPPGPRGRGLMDVRLIEASRDAMLSRWRAHLEAIVRQNPPAFRYDITTIRTAPLPTTIDVEVEIWSPAQARQYYAHWACVAPAPRTSLGDGCPQWPSSAEVRQAADALPDNLDSEAAARAAGYRDMVAEVTYLSGQSK